MRTLFSPRLGNQIFAKTLTFSPLSTCLNHYSFNKAEPAKHCLFQPDLFKFRLNGLFAARTPVFEKHIPVPELPFIIEKKRKEKEEEKDGPFIPLRIEDPSNFPQKPPEKSEEEKSPSREPIVIDNDKGNVDFTV
jgi:hypothetical protein